MKTFEFDENCKIVITEPIDIFLGCIIDSEHTKNGQEFRGYEIYDDETSYDLDINGKEFSLATFGFLNILEYTNNLRCVVTDTPLEYDDDRLNNMTCDDIDLDNLGIDFPGFILENFSGEIELIATNIYDKNDVLDAPKTYELLHQEFVLGFHNNVKIIIKSDNGDTIVKYAYFDAL